MKRRDFVKQSAALSAAGLLFSPGLTNKSRLIEQVGVQFFSLPKMLESDFEGALKMLSAIGFKEAELFGPYSFSPEADRKQGPPAGLGFTGSGVFGHTVTEAKSLFKKYNLTVSSLHTSFNSLVTGMAKLGEGARELGAEFVTLPAIPEEKRKTLDDYRALADTFNKIGTEAKKAGIKFAYHNHGYGLKEVDGKVPLKIILDNTDPSLVFLEMDLFWTIAGGADPIEYLQTYKNRYRLMHVKDMSKKVRFSGDGSNPQQWIELFPFMTTAGSGVVDLKTILPKAKENGVKHFIMEQDIVEQPEVALKKSYDYLASL